MAIHQSDRYAGDMQDVGAAKADPFAVDLGAPAPERSGLFAFFVGGVAIAGGLLAFLFLDSDVPAKATLTQSDGFIRVDTDGPRDPVTPHRNVPEAQTVTQ